MIISFPDHLNSCVRTVALGEDNIFFVLVINFFTRLLSNLFGLILELVFSEIIVGCFR